MRTTTYWGLLLLVAYAAAEGLSTYGLHILADGIAGERHTYYPADTLSAHHRGIIERLLKEPPDYVIYDPELGWTIKPHGLSQVIHGRRQGDYRYRANSQGIRAERDYSYEAADSITRIATFGESMTHCDEVGYADTWQARMAEADTGIEVINFGVGGYGLDQAYLRYLHDGAAFNPDIVVIGFMPEKIRRNVNVFRGFYVPHGGQPLSKPRFILSDRRLELIENPLGSIEQYRTLLDTPKQTLEYLGRHDAIYAVRYRSGPLDWSPSVRLFKMSREKLIRRFIGDGIIDHNQYNESSEAFAVTAALFDAFYRKAIENGSTPVAVILPNTVDIDIYLQESVRRHAALLDHFERQGHRHVDLMETLVQALESGSPMSDLFVGHYSPMANQLIADSLMRFLYEQELIGESPANAGS